MIELYINNSGEVDITSGPKGSVQQSAALSNNILSSSEDKAEIAKLNQEIESLKAQIQVNKYPINVSECVTSL